MPSIPPRSIGAGDLVSAWSQPLGAWTACVVTDVDPGRRTVGLLDLDWSGPEPVTIAEGAAAAPLLRTHHNWGGLPAHVNCDWLRPRGCTVVGVVPIPDVPLSGGYGSLWDLGEQLALQRQWDTGDRTSGLPGKVRVTRAELDRLGSRPDIWSLRVGDIDDLDCREVLGRFPALTDLWLQGSLGGLTNAKVLNDLVGLQRLSIGNLFGMTAADCLVATPDTAMEAVLLGNVPAAYADAMRQQWRPEARNGTFLEITGARDPGWVAENRDNPLREWDTRPHISAARYRKSLTAVKTARRAVTALTARSPVEDVADALVGVGREFALKFNALNGTRAPFIETEERDDLLRALAHIAAAAGTDAAYDLLRSGADAARTW